VFKRLFFLTLLIACVILAARVSQHHGWQLDLTAQRSHTLSTAAARALDALVEPLELTAYVPDYPLTRAQLRRLLAPYLAHPSRPSLRFVDPVEEPTLAREAGVARHGELHLHSAQRHEVIAEPTTAAIDAALARMALRGERWIVNLSGHGEAPIDLSPGGLATLAGRAERLGYRMLSLDPGSIDSIPDNTAVLLVSGPQRRYSPAVEDLISRFLADGGSLLWLVGDGPSPWIEDQFGISLLPGIVVDAAAASYSLESPDNAIISEYPVALLPQPPDGHAIMKHARGLRIDEHPDWWPTARLESSPRSWNETGDLRGQITRNPELGENAGPITVAVALQRSGNDLRQRVVVLGSREFLGNDQIGQADNLTLALGLLHWLSDNAALAAPTPAQDLDIDWSPQIAGVLALVLMGLLPAVYLALGLWSRHRRRQA
jgi:hypothetical protein